ncbi:MAG TPA: restriction endonuclease [Enteractinococcus sp.]
MRKVWGIHNDTLTTELVDEGFVSIGWDDAGDLQRIPDGREGLKAKLDALLPDAKPRAVALWAGILLRFRDDITVGDVVVAPYKPDSTINIGVVTGDYEFCPDAATHRHRRRVEWKQVGLSRTIFTQAALYEIGSMLTVFEVREHAAEFIAAISKEATTLEETTQIVEQSVQPAEEEVAQEPRASRIERHTRDFVKEALLEDLTHREFEEFIADLLKALGYQARVTPYSQDGGVDVIAHRDPLGIEPPLIKVQCKHQVGTIGAPEVQQLSGTQGPGELAIFATLGRYSRDAIAIERQRPGIRLLTGEDIVTLVLEHYSKLPERWRSVIPLTSLLVVADSAL